ncbi:MAG TPA: MFS transporter [Opitutaceae bacterium]|nr:MFS transporter [Opitutaceae bacterium]
MKIIGLRWYIVGLLCLVTAFNYLDRQTLALLAGTLEKEWGITTIQYSYITAAWLISYTIMNAVCGRIMDFLGTRRGLAIFVTLWSAADALHAFARSAVQFTLCRFFLGATEAANFPAGVKAVSEWFPMKERALAVGIFNSGTAIGAALAAPTVVWITLHLGWRYTFIVGALLSASWLAVWMVFYRVPRRHPWLMASELAHIEEDGLSAANRAPVSMRNLLSRKEAWGCILARILTDPISYLFAFWIPRFLQQERGFDLAAIGRYYWIPYVGLGLGNLAGGFIPSRLVRAGWSLNRARKTVMFVASCMVAACFLLITRVTSPQGAIGLLACAMFFHAAWANMTLPAEVFPQNAVGSVSGMAGGISSLIGTMTTLAIGRTVTVGSFTPIFVLYAALPMAGFIAVCSLVRTIGVVQAFPEADPTPGAA